MAVIPIHVNGPARIDLGFSDEINAEFGAVPGAVLPFGFTEDGVDIKVNLGTFDWHTDQTSNLIPGSVLYIGQTAEISAVMIRWDDFFLQTAAQIIQGPGFDGEVPSSFTSLIGRHIFSAEATDEEQQDAGVNRTLSLEVTSIKRTGLPRERGYKFLNVHMMDAQQFKLGIRATRMNIKFRAIPQDQSIPRGRVYQRTRKNL